MRLRDSFSVDILQAQSEVKKLETRLNTNLLKRLEELQGTASAPDIATDRCVMGHMAWC